jgi:hypothetical protein
MKKLMIALIPGAFLQIAYADETYLLDDGPPPEGQQQEWEGLDLEEEQRQESEEWRGREGDLQQQEEDIAPADPQFDPIDSDYRENEGAWEEN